MSFQMVHHYPFKNSIMKQDSKQGIVFVLSKLHRVLHTLEYLQYRTKEDVYFRFQNESISTGKTIQTDYTKWLHSLQRWWKELNSFTEKKNKTCKLCEAA